MYDFEAKVGDTGAALQFHLTDDVGSPADLTGATVTLSMRPVAGGPLKVAAATCTITDATAGRGEYRWSAGDVDTAGEFLAEVRVTLAGRHRTFPAVGAARVRFYPTV
jgi:hypothetical protein